MMYQEPVKNEVREKSLKKAVNLLTENRHKATIADRGYLRRVWNEININGSNEDKRLNRLLHEDTIFRWEKFYDSIALNKKPENLRVAYLCGPDPTNDLNVMIDLGILSENVWAFEANSSSYDSATKELLTSKYPFVKLIKSDFKSFIEFSNLRFDIIYLDFCGPIYNRSGEAKNIETLAAVAKYQALNSPGVLLTNFALMSQESDPEGFKIISKLTAGYLYPKEFQDDVDSPTYINDSLTCLGIDVPGFFELVSNDLPKYYSQFVTRLISDIFTSIIPADRIMNNPKMRNIFFADLMYKNKPRHILRKSIESLFYFTQNGGGGDIFVDPGEYSFIWTLFHYLGHSSQQELNNRLFQKHANKFVKQLSPFSKDSNDFFEKMAAFYYLKNENRSLQIFYSKSLKRISSNWRPFGKHVFCDVFLFHQLKDLLIRQITIPYQLNVAKSSRWQYKAKETEMFQDLFLFDECRYVYDWMPTIDMLTENLENPGIQLSYRYILDAVSKHTRWYNNEFFSGCAVISDGVKGFNSKKFKPRETIA